MDLTMCMDDDTPVMQAAMRRRSVEFQHGEDFLPDDDTDDTPVSSWHSGVALFGERAKARRSGLSESTMDGTTSCPLKAELLSEWPASERWESESASVSDGSASLRQWADEHRSHTSSSTSTPAVDLSLKKADSLLQRRRKRTLTLDTASAKSEASVPPLVGQESTDFKSRYTIEEKLGEGAATVVYRARLHSDSKQVALKYMRTGDEEELVKHARSEYDVLKYIQHPHIIRALEPLPKIGECFELHS